MTKKDQVARQRLQERYAGQGLGDNVLTTIELDLQITIPLTYRSLLHLVGNNPDAIPEWIGSDWTGPDLYEIQWAARTLVKNNPFLRALPDDAFVLLLHQGYSVLFVLSKLGETSPVFTYAETDDPWAEEFTRIAERLEDFMQELAPELWQAAKLLSS